MIEVHGQGLGPQAHTEIHHEPGVLIGQFDELAFLGGGHQRIQERCEEEQGRGAQVHEFISPEFRFEMRL